MKTSLATPADTTESAPTHFTRFEVVAALSELAMDLGVDFPSIEFSGDSDFRLRVYSLAELEAWMQVFDLKPEPGARYWADPHPNLPALMYQAQINHGRRWNGWYVGASGSQKIDKDEWQAIRDRTESEDGAR